MDSARRGILASATAWVILGCLMARLPASRSEVAHGCVSLGWTQQWTNCLSAMHRGPVVPLLPVGGSSDGTMMRGSQRKMRGGVMSKSTSLWAVP